MQKAGGSTRILAARFGRLPGRGKRFMQGATFLVGEVVIFVVRDKVNHRAIAQGVVFV
ncbi:MAG TPA: hypothetical protein VEG64_07010 [Candidatus Sulfotelmatobacter sp.]|nr:hypothetical protein [Candidatus Sulfotelmatobacter sp.]